MSQSTVEIHEFSTGIRPERTADGGWVSRGFTGQYMNVTLEEAIPKPVERSIANREFAVTEGASREHPAIIARVVGSEEDAWSVVAIVTRGRDEIGRSLSAYRYFLCEGANNLWKILAWLESQGIPTFNPFDIKDVGRPNLYPVTSQGTPILPPEAEALPFDTPEPILLSPNQYDDFKILNILAIRKANKNGQPVSWAFNVEALEKPRSFQVIQAASQRAYEILDRAIKKAPQVLAPVVADEEALKSAIRGLINSSQVKPQAVQIIAEALKNEQITEEYWRTLFNGQGAQTALSQKIYSPQMVRLITLRAMVIPDTLPKFLSWLNVKGGKNKPDENQTVSLEFQSAIRDSFPKEKLADGIKFILPKLLQKNITPEAVHWLLMVKDTAWFACREKFTDDIKYDLQQIAELFQSPQSQALLPSDAFKCGRDIWQKLISDWQSIRSYGYSSSKDYYYPLAELFKRLEAYHLSAYFYQLSDGMVPKDIFRKVNSRSVFSLPLYPKLTMVERIFEVFKDNYAHFFIIFGLIVVTVFTTIFIKIITGSEVDNKSRAQNQNCYGPPNPINNLNSNCSQTSQTGEESITSHMPLTPNELNDLQNFRATSTAINNLINNEFKSYKKESIQQIINTILESNQLNYDILKKDLNLEKNDKSTPQIMEWKSALLKYQIKKQSSGFLNKLKNPDGRLDNNKDTYQELKKDIKMKLKNQEEKRDN